MKFATRIFLIAAVAAAALAAAGCPQRRSIGEINANPGRFQDKEVVIAGRVVDSYGINIPGVGGGGAYKIDDGSGSIWVVTSQGVPTNGALIGIKGTVNTGVGYKGRNYGLDIYEEDRRYKRR